MKNKILVVIPAYNEEKTIKEVVERTLPFADVCVIDNVSRDKTVEIVESIPNVVLIKHKINTHIPQSILDGMKYGLDNNYKYIITMDVGLSHLPEELPRFINSQHSDLVLSFRRKKKNTPTYRKLLSSTATFLMNFAMRPIGSNLPKPRFKDVTSGYRRYSRKATELLLSRKLKAKSFDIHTESLMIIYRNGLKITEVPISYYFSNSCLNWKVIFDSFKMFLDILLTRRK